MGGFHLKNIDNQTQKTIEYIKNNNVKYIFPSHCTSDIVFEEFKNKLQNETTIVETGKIYKF